jgi:hypothetical protein
MDCSCTECPCTRQTSGQAQCYACASGNHIVRGPRAILEKQP